jgi:hypothetical protein
MDEAKTHTATSSSHAGHGRHARRRLHGDAEVGQAGFTDRDNGLSLKLRCTTAVMARWYRCGASARILRESILNATRTYRVALRRARRVPRAWG